MLFITTQVVICGEQSGPQSAPNKGWAACDTAGVIAWDMRVHRKVEFDETLINVVGCLTRPPGRGLDLEV